jgi:hypothetical protein
VRFITGVREVHNLQPTGPQKRQVSGFVPQAQFLDDMQIGRPYFRSASQAGRDAKVETGEVPASQMVANVSGRQADLVGYQFHGIDGARGDVRESEIRIVLAQEIPRTMVEPKPRTLNSDIRCRYAPQQAS